MMFRDRADAAERLAQIFLNRRIDHPVVLGIPRGGVVISDILARRLGAEHGVVVARKLGAPSQPELAIGAVTARGGTYIDPSIATMSGADETYIAHERQRQMTEARRREEAFDGGRNSDVAGRNVIVVDDGVATGATAIAAIRSVKAQGARQVIFAIPVGPVHTVNLLRHEADDVVCLDVESEFYAVGQFYDDFRPIEDAEVEALLRARRSGTLEQHPESEDWA
jgi:putative phosphoribosyl transferase